MAQRKTKSKKSSKSSKSQSQKSQSPRSKGSKSKAARSRAASPKRKTVKATRPAPARGRKPARKPVKAAAAAKTAKAKPVELYYWPTPNGWKITIFLEEAKLPYEIKLVNIGRGEQFTPEFLKISPNNRMPAIIDPSGPGGRPISVFESGAILRYLGEKTGKFYPADLRGKAKVDEWLFWQVGGLGPMSGQAGHFRNYAAEQIPYAIERYANEVNRLYGVMERQLSGGGPFLAGRYSIADMAAYPWVSGYEVLGQAIDAFPNLKAWIDRMNARPAVKRGMAVGQELRRQTNLRTDEEARKVLFGQRARVV